MNQTDSSSTLVEDDQNSGSAVFDPQGRRIGAIKVLYREVSSGRLTFADVAVGGFLGLGMRCYVFPWGHLVLDPVLNGYRVGQAEIDQITRIDKPYVSPKRLLHGRW